MTTIEQLAEFATGIETPKVSSAALDRLRLHLFDTLGAAIVGGTSAEAGAVAGLGEDIYSSGDVPGFGLPLRAPAPFAALATCVATRCTEVDDIHIGSCTTPSSVVVPVALALAHRQPDLDAETFLAAMLAGYELLTRFGMAVNGPTILYQGIWPTYLGGTLGAAATAARLLGFSTAETAHTLGTALTLSTGTSGSSRGVASRWLTLGCAVQNGILAALAARRGFSGDVTLLDGGWSRTTGIAIDTEKLVAGLGASFEIERVSIKPYCSSKQGTGGVCGFLQLLDEERLDPTAIDRIVVAVPKQYAQMIDQPAMPTERLTSILSVQYQVALAAYHRDELRDVLRPVIHQEPEFRALMGKVSVQVDESLQGYYPEAWPARVGVRTRSGEFTREVLHTKGDPTNPMNWNEEIEKVRDVLRGVVDAASVDRMAAACRGLGVGTPLTELLGVLPIASGVR